MRKDFSGEFDKIWTKIHSRIPMAFSRYADGEELLMKGIEIGGNSQATVVDKWSSPPQITKLGRDLLRSLNNVESNYYYAISCDTSNTASKEWLLKRIPQSREYITFANLFINSNYKKFQDEIQKIDFPVIIIGNENGLNSKYPFEIKEYMGFGNDIVNVWEEHSSDIIEMLVQSFIRESGQTFFISVGPLSEVIIDILWKINPTNQYIDVGSSLDEFTHGKKTRPYMTDGNFYAMQICEMTV